MSRNYRRNPYSSPATGPNAINITHSIPSSLTPALNTQKTNSNTSMAASNSIPNMTEQDLSLQIVLQNHAHCANTRYIFSGCDHICLQRCKVHPTKDMECTCPNPIAGFIAVKAESSCPQCSEQPGLRVKIAELQDRISQLTMQARELRKGKQQMGGMLCDMRGNVIEAELQRCKESLMAAKQSFIHHGGGLGLDVLGSKDFMWYACEADDLWRWGEDL